jgi:hypothetical protein
MAHEKGHVEKLLATKKEEGPLDAPAPMPDVDLSPITADDFDDDFTPFTQS